jgi:hypothetical protein
LSDLTGVILSSTPKSNNQSVALLNARRCGVTDSKGKYRVDIPSKVKCRVIALLPPDVVLSARYKISDQFVDLTDDNGDCWCVSNVDTVPSLMVMKSITETGTVELVTYPEIVGMSVCVELNQES